MDCLTQYCDMQNVIVDIIDLSIKCLKIPPLEQV